MTYLFATTAIALCAIHYPLARFYVSRSLAGLDEEVSRGIRNSLRGRMRRLLWAWLLALGILAVILFAPGMSEQASGLALGAMIFGFHALWWGFVMPVLRGLERALHARGIERPAGELDAVRTAVLQPRTAGSYLRPWMMPLTWSVAITGTALIVARSTMLPPVEPTFLLMVVIFGAMGWAFAVLWTWWIRKEIAQSYPVDCPEALVQARMEAAESLRKFRVNGIYWLQLAAVLGFLGSAWIILEVANGTVPEAASGVYGAVMGTLVGMGGAVFGVMASLRQQRAMRVNGVATPTAENGVDPGH